MKLNKWGIGIGLVVLVLLFCIPFYTAPADSEFGGTDSAVTDILQENGTEPWFKPIAEPAGPEVESGLFAMQAALGSGIMFYCLGRMAGRRKAAQDAQNPTSVED